MALPLYRAETGNVSKRTGWYAFVRLLFLIVIAAPGLISLYVFHGWSDEVIRDLILFMVAIASNGLFYALIIIHKNDNYQRLLAGIWIGLDILLVTFLIYANGGIESRNVILYVMPILIAAAIFGRRGIYTAAISSGVMYAVVILLDYRGIIHSMGAFDPALHHDLAYVVNAICFFPSVLLVIAVAVDFITNLLIQKEREAQKSLAELERAQKIARIGSWEWDLARDEITWSEGLAKILDTYHAMQPLHYREYMMFVHPDDQKAHLKTIEMALKKKKAFTSNYRLVMPDGQAKYVHSEGQPLMDRDGHLTKMFGIAQDVTNIHHLDDAKREFVSLASHQLRTPASGVKAFLSLLIDGYAGKLTRKQQQFVKRAYEANNRQLDIIDNLLSLASIESGKLVLSREPVNLTDIIRTCLPHHRLEIREKKQKLSTSLPKTPLIIRGDASHLRMAIDNLISNAVKYTPEKGSITVTSHMDERAAYLDVIDSGIGIAKADIPSLFQKFSRLSISTSTSGTVGGTGLGLYLAKCIVKLHHGTISVKSRRGEGAQFRIKLPLAKK